MKPKISQKKIEYNYFDGYETRKLICDDEHKKSNDFSISKNRVNTTGLRHIIMIYSASQELRKTVKSLAKL